MRKQKRFNAHYGEQSANIFIYDHGRKYVVDLKKGSVRKILGKEGSTISTEIQAYRTQPCNEVERLRTQSIGDSPEDHVGFVLDYVKSLIRKADKKALSVPEIVQSCGIHGISEDVVRQSILKMSATGEIFMMDRNTISSIHLFK
jgi:hypothetical protein